MYLLLILSILNIQVTSCSKGKLPLKTIIQTKTTIQDVLKELMIQEFYDDNCIVIIDETYSIHEVIETAWSDTIPVVYILNNISDQIHTTKQILLHAQECSVFMVSTRYVCETFTTFYETTENSVQRNLRRYIIVAFESEI